MKKIFGNPNWVQKQSFHHFLKVAPSVLLDIAQDWDNAYHLAELKPQKKKKREGAQIGTEMIFFYSNVVERPLKLTC